MEVKFITIEEYKNLLSILNEIKVNLNPQSRKAVTKLSDQWLTLGQTCETLNVSRRTLQAYRDEGVLSFSQHAGKIYFKASDIEAHLEKHYKPAFKNVR
jgi:hypothetical protein